MREIISFDEIIQCHENVGKEIEDWNFKAGKKDQGIA